MNAIEGIKILLVDDEPHILQFLELGLANEGYEVKTALDGLTGVNLAQKFKPHIAILDVMMPGMDGFEVCRMIKKAPPRLLLLCLLQRMRSKIESRV